MKKGFIVHNHVAFDLNSVVAVYEADSSSFNFHLISGHIIKIADCSDVLQKKIRLLFFEEAKSEDFADSARAEAEAKSL